MCYYSKLEGSGGKCRTCLVEVSKGSEKDPRPMPKLVASCRTTVMDGMEVKNFTSERVLDARAGVVEFLLINHPLDCPICDQAGECHLQDLAYEHGKAGTRYEFQRRTFEKHTLGDKIQLHMTRCILCYRCVMVADQLTKNREHGVLDRGEHAEITSYLEKNLDNEFIGNVIDVCPVGALTDKTFRFKNRVWFLKPLNAHRDCEKCCGKVTLWNRGDEVFRVTARKDQWGEVEDWICNDCRFDKKKTSDWIIEGPREMARHSVISANKYIGLKKPTETIGEVIGKKPRLFMDIRKVSGVNKKDIDLSLIEGPAHSTDFDKDK
jgi:NADH-quinone oxidoreductase subunit G